LEAAEAKEFSAQDKSTLDAILKLARENDDRLKDR
jgi:hypothetical protein